MPKNIDWRTIINDLSTPDDLKEQEFCGNLIKIVNITYLLDQEITGEKKLIRAKTRAFDCGHMSESEALDYSKQKI